MLSLRRHVSACGLSSLIGFTLLTVVSHTVQSHQPRMLALLVSIVLTTLGGVWLLALERRADGASARDTRTALGFAVAFGVLAVLQRPVFGGDLWYNLAEGRLAASGANVYTTPLDPAALDGLPVPTDARPVTMPYGPAWVWISDAIARATSPAIAWEFATHKTVTFVAWLMTLLLIYRSQIDDPSRQFQSTVLLGWLPFPLIAAIGEAHNDIVMVALMTGWLVHATPAGATALVASALIKYTSAPLVALAVVDAIVRKHSRTLIALGLSIALAAIVAVVYWQDGALIAGLQRNQQWRQYTPVALMDWLVRAQHMPRLPATLAITAWRTALAGLVIWYGLAYRRTPTMQSRCALSAAVMLAIVLGAGYIHTHYFLWVVPGVLLARDRFLMVLTFPYVLFLPFMQILRVSGAVPTPFRLTLTLQLLVVATWLLYAVRERSTRRGIIVSAATSPGANT